jgi:hypothetical protein
MDVNYVWRDPAPDDSFARPFFSSFLKTYIGATAVLVDELQTLL